MNLGIGTLLPWGTLALPGEVGFAIGPTRRSRRPQWDAALVGTPGSPASRPLLG
jgi:hypothetical protein